MNYRHAFHAGNHADVLKHLTLTLALSAMAKKETPLAVLDTHAGVGMYDLTGEEAVRSPEWRDGIGRLQDWAEAPAAFAPYLDLVRRAERLHYPGSPWITAQLLRPQDRLMACELHGPTFEALRDTMGSAKNIHLHARDGYEAVKALLPPPEPRGLCLIDPPFEKEDELSRSVATLKLMQGRWRHGVALWWRPLKDVRALDAADSEILNGAKTSWLRADLAIAPPQRDGKLAGSSMLVLNPPFGVEATLREALPLLAQRLAQAPGGFGRVSAG
jgi:23S rRNA (adenine2030-N6)-methyltransferase